jgi:mono/diheme cytochrome c family protein
MKWVKAVAIGILIVFALALGFVYGGVFNVAADEPHWGVTLAIMEATREKSIVVRARSVGAPPALGDPQRIAAGAQEYAEMCTGCHLAPGMKDTELRAGLYPKPPNLAEHAAHRKPAEAFWIIKHGLKMTGMPAWGVTHDDMRIWSMVAFLQKLPELSAAEYKSLVAEKAGEGHTHGDTAGEAESHGMSMPGMSGDRSAAAPDAGGQPSTPHDH